MTRCMLDRMSLALHPMAEDDLYPVGSWLRRPHVARWRTPDTADAEIAKCRKRYTAATVSGPWAPRQAT